MYLNLKMNLFNWRKGCVPFPESGCLKLKEYCFIKGLHFFNLMLILVLNVLSTAPVLLVSLFWIASLSGLCRVQFKARKSLRGPGLRTAVSHVVIALRHLSSDVSYEVHFQVLCDQTSSNCCCTEWRSTESKIIHAWDEDWNSGGLSVRKRKIV